MAWRAMQIEKKIFGLQLERNYGQEGMAKRAKSRRQGTDSVPLPGRGEGQKREQKGLF
jgi:hypothetical protein